MIVRIRDKSGTWRLELDKNATRIQHVKELIFKLKRIDSRTQILSKDFLGESLLADEMLLSETGIEHGSLLYLSIREQDVFDTLIDIDKSAPLSETILENALEEGPFIREPKPVPVVSTFPERILGKLFGPY